jgi:hypothetical protein
MEEQTRSEILKTIPYGFYITGVVGSDGEANGFTTCWVSQVSFEPQQVVVAVRKDQHTHDLIEEGGVFSLNFLDTEQEDLALKFTQPLQPENGTLAGSPYSAGKTGAPLFDERGRGPYRLPRGSRRRKPRASRRHPHRPRHPHGVRRITAAPLHYRFLHFLGPNVEQQAMYATL